jgi:hypothetical protein
MKLKLFGIFALSLTVIFTSCKEEEIEATTDNSETPTGVDCDNYLFGGDSHRLALTNNPTAVTESGYNYKIYLQNSDECKMDVKYKIIQSDLDSSWTYQFCLAEKCFSTSLLNRRDTLFDIHADSIETKYQLKCLVMSNGVSGTGTIAVQLTDAEYTQYVDTAYFNIDLP